MSKPALALAAFPQMPRRPFHVALSFVLAGLLFVRNPLPPVTGSPTEESSTGGCPVCPVCESKQSTKCETVTTFTVQLRWLKSAQFAGFYAAEELGYWEEECLKVILYQARSEYKADAIWEHGANVAMPHYLFRTFIEVHYERVNLTRPAAYFRAHSLTCAPLFLPADIRLRLRASEVDKNLALQQMEKLAMDQLR
eukprot:scaffold151164_cov31-Prasinocladus_malaysianus.AAC.2